MKTYTVKEVAATIDHAVLKPVFTRQDVIANARLCIRRGVRTLCVRPTDVALAASELQGSGVDVSVVVGFPHGSNRTETKVLEAALALQDGAKEIDMVMNLGRFLSGDEAFVQQDIAAVVNEARKSGGLVKVILESCYLSGEQVAAACRLAQAAGADFVKTSTGFGDGPATPEVIAIMVATVGGRMGVKASGGIRSWETAVGYLDQGCTRLGVAATDAVLDGAIAHGQY